MATAHEENWPTATNPRHLLRLSRVRPSGRQYTLLACAAVRHLIPGPRTELGTRILDALERFAVAQPRKGVQTHVWRDVVRRNVPEVPESPRIDYQRLGTDAVWINQFVHRLTTFSQVGTAVVNVLFDIAFREAENRARSDAIAEVSALLKRPSSASESEDGALLSIKELRDEIMSRTAPQRRDAIRAAWARTIGRPSATRVANYLIVERVEQRIAEASASACELVREVFGNPFRPPVIEPHWLEWNHGAVRHIAEQITASGDFTDLPILGDALEDAGCCDAELLAHCREVKTHVPGCWALDAVLGR